MFTGLYTGVDKYLEPHCFRGAVQRISSLFLWTSDHHHTHHTSSYTSPLTLSLEAPCLIHHLINMGQDLPPSNPAQLPVFIHSIHRTYSYSDGS